MSIPISVAYRIFNVVTQQLIRVRNELCQIMVIETWRWTQKQDIGPSPRVAFSMAYDSNAKKIVLF